MMSSPNHRPVRPSRRRLARFVTVVLTTAVLLASCGGGSDDEASDSTDESTTDITEASVDTGDTTTTLAVAEPLELEPNQVFQFGGVRYTLETLTATPNEFDSSTAALTAVFLANVSALEGSSPPDMKLVVDSIDVPLSFFDGDPLDPGTNTRISYSGAVDGASVALLEAATLVIGDADSNQAVVPLEPGSDEGAVRHPEIETTVGTKKSAPDARAGTVNVTFQKFVVGASNRSGKPSAAESIAVGAAFDMCTTELDQEFEMTVTDHEGITHAWHSTVYEFDTDLIIAETGEVVGTTCPATETVEFWADVPVSALGKKVTINLNANFGADAGWMTFAVQLPEIDETTIDA